MANEKPCETCEGSGVLIGDKADARGERTDDPQPCHDCDGETVVVDDPDDERHRFDVGDLDEPVLERGARCSVYGRPGTVKYRCPDGAIGVSLDGEGRRVDEWDRSQVQVVA